MAVWWIALGCAAGSGSTSATRPGGPAVDAMAVRATGEAGSYTLYVTLRSDETGCDRYADWWEVLDPDGALVFRRILDHSHPDEQPFERSGGPVAIEAHQEVIVRGHLHDEAGSGGYVGQALRGAVDAGFSAWPDADGFAPTRQDEAPQPEDCLF